MKAIGKLTLAVAVLAVAAVPVTGQDKDKRLEVVRLGDLAGKAIHYKDLKAEIGTVKDVVVDLQRGRAVFAAVARKEDPDRIVAVPLGKFRVARSADGKKLDALRIEDDKLLAEAPSATKDEWDKDNRAVMARLASKEGAESLVRASKVKKASVVDPAGERIGEIDEVMVNLENSRLLALVGVGGVLGVGERRHVVPWEILRIREAKKDGVASFTLNVPRDRLEKGPILGTDEENRLADPTWVAGLYEHYQYGPLGGEREAFRCARADAFIGAEVASAAKPDDEFGSIEALAIVPHTGQIAYVAFDVGGKLYAVPLGAFKVTLEKNDVKKVLIDADKTAFKGMRAFDKDRWPDHADPSWKTGDREESGEAASPMVLRSADVLDAGVKDSRRVTFGEIEDFVLDLDHAKVLYVCVGSGGFLGIGETLYAIPWKAMKWAGDKDKFFTVNTDRKTLERSVEFDEKRLNDPNYIRSIYAVYGLEFDPKKMTDKKAEPKTQP
ncbi:MAG TPA: PRC-barrel domain-containing protein [Planctomycetota bacterium]